MVMVHHARSLSTVAGGQEPSPYVKVYLLPDQSKVTKRKTKVVRRNCHPTFMEMVSRTEEFEWCGAKKGIAYILPFHIAESQDSSDSRVTGYEPNDLVHFLLGADIYLSPHPDHLCGLWDGVRV